MKKMLFVLIFSSGISAFSQQTSHYYVDLNQNINANIKEDIEVSGSINVNKNISTIDYGQLALANAQSEKNRLEHQKYMDEKEKNMSLAIAENPVLAYDYGAPFLQEFDKKGARERGFKKFSWGVSNST
ncbi:hypothetical protein D9O36_09390 [Zobellia amurskyensis]|uniref:Uncharacterized protein n=2 Tax=Zobellia amurskyensis TaxID=248905 RepID=A0A7X2ZTG4_9FLAO|nr:hypothetical protein [Zobellia amurskyensis]